MATKKTEKRKPLITPVAIISYPHLWTPTVAKNKDGTDDSKAKAKYSCSLIFPKGTDIKALKRVAVATCIEKYGDKTKEMIKTGKLNLPFRDEWEEKGYPEGSVFINVRTEQRPGVVSRIPDPKTGKPMTIEDEDLVYPGCLVKASLAPFMYDYMGNKGMSFALNNIQKWDEGERLDNRTDADEDFDADESLAADLEDLTDETETEDEVVEEDEDLADLLNEKE